MSGARDASRKSLCDEVRKANIDATEVKQNVAKSAEELRRNIALNSIKNLGVLAEDAHGCYLGLLAGVSAGKSNTLSGERNYLLDGRSRKVFVLRVVQQIGVMQLPPKRPWKPRKQSQRSLDSKNPD